MNTHFDGNPIEYGDPTGSPTIVQLNLVLTYRFYNWDMTDKDDWLNVVAKWTVFPWRTIANKTAQEKLWLHEFIERWELEAEREDCSEINLAALTTEYREWCREHNLPTTWSADDLLHFKNPAPYEKTAS